MAVASLSTFAAAGLIEWSALTASSLRADLLSGMEQAQSNISKITAIPLPNVSFENCIEELERAAEPLNGPACRLEHLVAHMGGGEIRSLHGEMVGPIAEFYGSIPLNEDLWARVRVVRDSQAAKSLTGIRRRLLEETVRDFLDGGAELPRERKAQLLEIRKQLAQKTQKFMEHLQDAMDGWELYVEDPAELEGLPESILPILRADAERKGRPNAYRLTLQEPVYCPALRYLRSDSLRRTLWAANDAICSGGADDNGPLIGEILALRKEEAEILGFSNFSDYVLSRRMAGSGARALQFTENMHGRFREPFRREFAQLQEFKKKKAGTAAGPLEPWQVSYWSEEQCRELYNFDDEELRPYLQLSDVLAGLFGLAERLYGLRIVERPTRAGSPANGKSAVSVWHRDVRYFEVLESDGTPIGSFYADLFPREGKRPGAWENELVPGCRDADGHWQRPVGTISANLTPPTDSQPSRLTHREVETLFHEFGHLLHSLFGRVDYASLNGTKVAWDFVELPSQVMENWTWEYDCLRTFARNRSEGNRVLPEELFRRLRATRNYLVAIRTMRQLSLQKMDLDLHMFYNGSPLDDFIGRSIADYVPHYPTEPRPIVRRFVHLFGDPVGYGSAYYSYMWAEVLDADAFERFLDEGLFSRSVAKDFRTKILERGSGEPAEQLYRNFRGRDADPAALLRRSGLLPSGHR
ncbi:MAG: M3 family metallopeptidase [Puniceicoccales bacterium]|jgi:oligopeptidase A|nr:M3 family metallopeptidase [Puniceicoccales bacterium]